MLDPAQVRYLAALEAAVVERAQLRRRRQYCDGRERLAGGEINERVGQERQARAVIGEAEELDRRARAHRERRPLVVAEIAQDGEGELGDLPRAAVADLERLHLDPGTRSTCRCSATSSAGWSFKRCTTAGVASRTMRGNAG